MDKLAAKMILQYTNLDEDGKMDILMYLAEYFGLTVHDKDNKNVTYYLCSDYKIFEKTKE